MSEFDELKKDAEGEAQQHPQQVHEAEQDAEKEGKDLLDKGSGGQQGDAGSGDSGQQGHGQGGQQQ